MVIRLHKKARTTPEIRRETQASDLPATVLAENTGFIVTPSVNGASAIRWKMPPIGPTASMPR